MFDSQLLLCGAISASDQLVPQLITAVGANLGTNTIDVYKGPSTVQLGDMGQGQELFALFNIMAQPTSAGSPADHLSARRGGRPRDDDEPHGHLRVGRPNACYVAGRVVAGAEVALDGAQSAAPVSGCAGDDQRCRADERFGLVDRRRAPGGHHEGAVLRNLDSDLLSMAKSPTAWKPGQSGNPRGPVAGVALVRNLLDPHRPALVEKALQMALAGDVVALRICMDRVAPQLRAESPNVRIPGLVDAPTLAAKGEAIIAAVGTGDISPDAASMLLQAIASASQVQKTDELARKIEALEARRES